MNWEEYAACHDNPTPFMDDFNEEAMHTCWNRCPVRIQCLKAALACEKQTPNLLHMATIRGGYTPEERYIMLRHELEPN